MRGKGSIACTCEVCGKPFWTFRSRRADGKDRTCSVECGGILRRGPRKTIADVLWAGVPNRPADGCWEWHGPLTPTGYASMRDPRVGKPRKANRIAWEVASGEPVPIGAHVLHTCDNRRCVRNDGTGTYTVDGVTLPRRGHLFLGTQHDNNRDKEAKGRQAKGERSGAHVLLEAQIPIIRAKRAAGVSGPKLAAEYGVSSHTIYAVCSGQLWRHVT